MKEITEDKGRVRPVVEGDFQCDENGNSTRFYEILSLVGYIKDDGTKIGYISKTDVPIGIPITDTDYWYPFQVIAVPKGDKGDTGADGKSAYDLYIEHGGTIAPVEAWLASLQGKDGKDGQPLMLRVTPDGQSLEISDDGGHTWYMFEKNFSKLRVLGYLNSVSELPRNAEIGDIYGVKLPNEEVEPGHSAYELWINTVKGWNEDYVITKIYDYDTELPSYAAEGATVVVPVKYLTLDKQKVDGYKVYRFDQYKNGWTMILNTAEIFASKEDIVNHGDNVYALVQGDSKKTYHDVTNWINGSLDENNKYQEDLTSIIGTCSIDGSVRELSYNIANGYKADIRILADEQRNPVDIDNPTIIYDTEVVEGTGSITVPSNAKSIVVTMKSVNEEEEIPTSAGTMVSMYSVKEEKIILYKRNTGWVYFGTNASITYVLAQNVEDGTSTNILSGEAVKLKFAEFAAALDAFKQEVKDTYGDYEENSEFVKVVLDNNNKVLYGIQTNGNFYFGAGVPQQVKDYIEEKISSLSLDEYEDIVAFLLDYLGSDTTLKVIIDGINASLEEKVDKEEGKSLINEDYIIEIENPEFTRVYLGANENILWGLRVDGTVFYGAGVPPQVVDYIEQRIADLSLDEYEDIVAFLDNLEKGDKTLTYLLDQKLDAVPVDNPEFVRAFLDSNDRILEATKQDGSKLFGGDVTILGNLTINGFLELLGNSVIVTDTPEFIAAVISQDNKVLFGLRKNGDFYFGCNIPSQIKSYVSTEINAVKDIESSILETLNGIVEFLSGFESDVTLLTYLNETYGEYKENFEYVEVKTDNTDKITEGTRKDGTKVLPGGVETPNVNIGGTIIELITNPEYREVKLDSLGKILEAIKHNGTKEIFGNLNVYGEIDSKTIRQLIQRLEEAETELGELDKEALKSLSVALSEEYLSVGTDGEGKVLNGRTLDGGAFEKVGFSTPKISVDGHLVENFEDPESRREIKIDAERKIISFRDKEGILHEEAGIETSAIKTNSLQLSSEGMTEFQQALIDSGFNPKMPIDFSDKAEIHIPKPTSLPIVNLTLDTPITTSADEVTGTIEFYDKSGNYFKKDIEAIGWQGQSTQSFPKKSFKFDFSDCTVKIGNWVPQDSFHLKAQYTDIFIGKPNIAYNYWRDIIEFGHDGLYIKPWLDSSKFSYYKGISEFDEEVRLTPDGFPFVLYLNGDYYGVYTWNIKKAKENYAMKKTKTSNVHIDPEDIASMLKGLSIPWTDFELRNPKPKKKKDGWELTDINGNAYNPDAPLELIGTDSPNYDSTNTSHVKTAEVKGHIIDFKDICAEVITNNNKVTFETYFDKDWFIDFILWSNAILDGDGIVRNTQYLYWGGKWYIAPYDCDQIFGCLWLGSFISRNWRAVDRVICGLQTANTIYSVFYNLYKTDIDARYKVLRDAGILSAEYLYNKLAELVKTIGKEEYSKNFDKWPLTPCYREPNDNPQWKWMGDYFEGTPRAWNDVDTFNEGEYVSITEPNGTQPYYYLCLETCQGVRPYTDAYLGDGVYNRPIFGGFFDSLTRTEMWLKARFTFLDGVFNYTQN